MMSNPKSLLSAALSIFFALALSSCSSSSDDDDAGTANATPKFSSSSSVDAIENSTDSFYTATATDSDSSDTLTFSISSGDDAAKFSINSSSGALSFSSAADYESPNGSGDTSYKYLLQLKVSDNAGASDTLDLTVTLTNDTSDDGGGSNTVPTETASGYVVDGYIRNAFVCLDIDNNNECDDDEPYSKSSGDGSYSLDVSALSDAQKGGAQLITIGGTDNDSGYRFTGQLQAPLYTDASGNIHITPITTLLAAQVTANTADAIDQRVADLQAQLVLEVDPRTDPVTNTGLQKVAIQVQKSLELIAAALQVQQFGLPDEEAMDAAMQALADDLADAAEANRNGSSISANSIVAMATSDASPVDLPVLIGEIDTVTLSDGTNITVPENISSSAEAMADEINTEFDNATDSSDINNLIYAVAETVEDLKDEIANTEDLANLELDTTIEAGEEPSISRILSLIAYEPENDDDYDAMFEYLAGKDSNNDITGSTTVARFNDLLDGWLAEADSLESEELNRLAELQQLALAADLEESASSDSLSTFESLLGGDNGFFWLNGIKFEDNQYPYPTLELAVNYMLYDASENFGGFARIKSGFNTSTGEFDLSEDDGESNDEYDYMWETEQKIWIKTYDDGNFTVSDDKRELNLLKQSADDSNVLLNIGTVRIESEISLQNESRVFSVEEVENVTVIHEFNKGRELLLVTEYNREQIWFEDWRLENTDGTDYSSLSDFLDDCEGNLAYKEQCAMDKENDNGVEYFLGINSPYNNSGANYLVHLQYDQNNDSGSPIVIDDKAGLYEKGYLNDNETEVISITHIEDEYLYIYGSVDEIVIDGNTGLFMMYGDQIVFALGKSLQAEPDISVTYDKDAYEDFVEGSGDQLKEIVDDLQ